MSISALSGKRIVIDPGHGGKFPGAIGPAGTKEKDVVLSIGRELAADLVELGAEVKMTRSEDVEVLPGGSLRDDLKARVDIANNWPADLFISIHSNAAENTSAVGTETYVAKQASDRSKALAKLVHQCMMESPGLKDRGVRSADFYVIRNTTMPAILVETGFISNAAEEQKLADPAVQSLFAKSIGKGVEQYFQVEPHLKPDAPRQESDEPPPEEYLLAPGDPPEMLFARR